MGSYFSRAAPTYFTVEVTAVKYSNGQKCIYSLNSSDLSKAIKTVGADDATAQFDLNFLTKVLTMNKEDKVINSGIDGDIPHLIEALKAVVANIETQLKGNELDVTDPKFDYKVCVSHQPLEKELFFEFSQDKSTPVKKVSNETSFEVNLSNGNTYVYEKGSKFLFGKDGHLAETVASIQAMIKDLNLLVRGKVPEEPKTVEEPKTEQEETTDAPV